MTTKITVKKCCECPFKNSFIEDEWQEYYCELGGGPPPVKVGPNQYEDRSHIKTDTIIPPKWCRLRKEKFTVELSQELKDGKP